MGPDVDGNSTGRVRFAIGLAVLCVTSCADPHVADVTLAQLVAQQGDYAGRLVMVTGTLRSHPDPLHYWIEDSAHHRVELNQPGDLSGREGERLTVTGLFRYRQDKGRRIEVASLITGD